MARVCGKGRSWCGLKRGRMGLATGKHGQPAYYPQVLSVYLRGNNISIQYVIIILSYMVNYRVSTHENGKKIIIT